MRAVATLLIVMGMSFSVWAEGWRGDDAPARTCSEAVGAANEAPPPIRSNRFAVMGENLLAKHFAKVISFEDPGVEKLLNRLDIDERYLLVCLIAGYDFDALPAKAEWNHQDTTALRNLGDSFLREVIKNTDRWEMQGQISPPQLTIKLKPREGDKFDLSRVEKGLVLKDPEEIKVMRDIYDLFFRINKKDVVNINLLQETFLPMTIWPDLRAFDQAYRIYVKIQSSRDSAGKLPVESINLDGFISRFIGTSLIGFGGGSAAVYGFPGELGLYAGTTLLLSSSIELFRNLYYRVNPVRTDFNKVVRILKNFPYASRSRLKPMSLTGKRALDPSREPESVVPFLAEVSGIPTLVAAPDEQLQLASLPRFNDSWLAEPGFDLSNEAHVRKLPLEVNEITDWLILRRQNLKALKMASYQQPLQKVFSSYKEATIEQAQASLLHSLSRQMSAFVVFATSALDELDEMADAILKIRPIIENRFEAVQIQRAQMERADSLASELSHQGDYLAAWLKRLDMYSVGLAQHKSSLVGWKRAIESLQLMVMDCDPGLCEAHPGKARADLLSTFELIFNSPK